jgi:hypothetical protein
MNKIIIVNKSDLSDYDSLAILLDTIATGRISNEGRQYCYLTLKYFRGKKYQISSDLNKRSDRFTILNDPR